MEINEGKNYRAKSKGSRRSQVTIWCQKSTARKLKTLSIVMRIYSCELTDKAVDEFYAKHKPEIEAFLSGGSESAEDDAIN